MGSIAFREGFFEIQDEASQLIAQLVEPVRGGLHLDYCAGAGGKSLAMASKLPRQARILAADVRESALRRAKLRAERAGVKRIGFHCLADGPLPIASRSAARVLVDAPCSGTGTLRRQLVRKWRMTETDLAESIRSQEKILRDASLWVRPGGRLVYATCSVLRAENEGIVGDFLKEHPDWRLVAPREILGRSRSRPFEREGFFRSYPHLHSTDGFTAAILVAPRA
jgi:16S rRNA (cytosine967-C5)-methyltransferase